MLHMLIYRAYLKKSQGLARCRRANQAHEVTIAELSQELFGRVKNRALVFVLCLHILQIVAHSPWHHPALLLALGLVFLSRLSCSSLLVQCFYFYALFFVWLQHQVKFSTRIHTPACTHTHPPFCSVCTSRFVKGDFATLRFFCAMVKCFLMAKRS